MALQLSAIIALFVAGAVLEIAGIVFLTEAATGRPATGDHVGTIAGMTCLGIGSTMIVISAILAFIAGWRQRQRDASSPPRDAELP